MCLKCRIQGDDWCNSNGGDRPTAETRTSGASVQDFSEF